MQLRNGEDQISTFIQNDIASITNRIVYVHDLCVMYKKGALMYMRDFLAELVEVLFLYPYNKIEYVVERLAINRRTASKYLRTIGKPGLLRSEQKWKKTLFINTRLFDLLRE
jgi:hypothetical protein